MKPTEFSLQPRLFTQIFRIYFYGVVYMKESRQSRPPNGSLTVERQSWTVGTCPTPVPRTPEWTGTLGDGCDGKGGSGRRGVESHRRTLGTERTVKTVGGPTTPLYGSGHKTGLESLHTPRPYRSSTNGTRPTFHIYGSTFPIPDLFAPSGVRGERRTEEDPSDSESTSGHKSP